MYKYAEIYAGKIRDIKESPLSYSEFVSIFSPKSYWIDITGLSYEIGYVQSFVEGQGIVFVKPFEDIPETLESLKDKKLLEVNSWTAKEIVGGFLSACTGEPVRYDSDTDTQLTVSSDLNTISLAPDKFAQYFPQGYPMRGYPAGSTTKSVFYLSIEQLIQWNVDMALHRGVCKQKGWEYQESIKDAKSQEELDKIVIGG